MKAKLTSKTGLLTVLFYLVFSIGADLFIAIFLSGGDSAAEERVIDGYIESGMYAIRSILLVGLRNGGLAEWKVFAITLVIFSVLHLVNLISGGILIYLLIVATGGVVYYVTRRVFNTLWVAIGIHALHDFAFTCCPAPTSLVSTCQTTY